MLRLPTLAVNILKPRSAHTPIATQHVAVVPLTAPHHHTIESPTTLHTNTLRQRQGCCYSPCKRNLVSQLHCNRCRKRGRRGRRGGKRMIGEGKRGRQRADRQDPMMPACIETCAKKRDDLAQLTECFTPWILHMQHVCLSVWLCKSPSRRVCPCHMCFCYCCRPRPMPPPLPPPPPRQTLPPPQ